ncbi:MAG: hypothetical protein HC773_22375, partial [Scytonema sp. CRU_2_7]|nr:hypothetical protein [Scytonema sp. CRU_2_7]
MRSRSVPVRPWRAAGIGHTKRQRSEAIARCGIASLRCARNDNSSPGSEYRSHCQLKLKLNEAIYLHPLEEAQIKNYLVSIGRSTLWTNIQNEKSILKLVTNPLFLSMMLITTETDSTIEVWTRFYNDREESCRFLFDNYITEILEKDKVITQKNKNMVKKLDNKT